MLRITALLCLLALAAAAGCADIKADASGYSRPQSNAYSPPPNPDADPRSTLDLQRENALLRQQIDKLEHERADWEAAVDRKDAEIRALKHQRDDMKKQRDRAKKAIDD